MADGETLLQVRLVSKRWNQICNSDRIIRKKIRKHLKQRKIQIVGLLGDISYVPKSQTTVFRKKNVQYDCIIRPAMQNRNLPIQVKSYVAEFGLKTIANANSLARGNVQKTNSVPIKCISVKQKRRLRRL
ncbi:uncharacterized protein LOC142324421 [Lycorma delicatula]|uniref:uncharacterized protein LOC142324421 n=1 Tax=Lycorma delicatula TaxID=130591 RepID=UPI003F519176